MSLNDNVTSKPSKISKISKPSRPKKSKSKILLPIKILVDIREASLLEKLNTLSHDNSQFIIESTRLDIGDIHILQLSSPILPYNSTSTSTIDTTAPNIDNITNIGDTTEELPKVQHKLVLERKTVADMIASIKDGRYREQKHRLNAWTKRALENGKQRRYGYILEGFIDNNKHDSASQRLYWGSQISTILRDNLPLFNTLDTQQTAAFIFRLAHRMSDPSSISDLFPPLLNPIPSLAAQNAAPSTSDNIKPIIFNSNPSNGNGGGGVNGGGLTSRSMTTDNGVKVINIDNTDNRSMGLDNGVRNTSPAIPCDITGIRRVKVSTDVKNIYNKTSKSSKSSKSSKKERKKEYIQEHSSEELSTNDGNNYYNNDGNAGIDGNDIESFSRLSYLDSVIKKKKSSNITPANCHVIMLCQIPGITSRSAHAIMTEFNYDISSLFAYLGTAANTPIDFTTMKANKSRDKFIAKTRVKLLQRLVDIPISCANIDCQDKNKDRQKHNSDDTNMQNKDRKLGQVLAMRLMDYLVNVSRTNTNNQASTDTKTQASIVEETK